ncbi:unannotated protein [freshwater metagenome]|uniref:Unannotated protein n=1 Tax=freshwater metagenome TaxID=449393 RepID=A0A6J7NRY5_9ZZZZ
MGCEAGANAIGEARSGIRLVDDDRNTPAAGSEIGRERGIPSETDHDLRAELVEETARVTHRMPGAWTDPQQVKRGPTRHWRRPDGRQVIAALRHERALKTALSTDDEDGGRWVGATEGVGKVERRLNVPRRSPSGEHDAQGLRHQRRRFVCAVDFRRSAMRAPGS